MTTLICVTKADLFPQSKQEREVKQRRNASNEEEKEEEREYKV